MGVKTLALLSGCLASVLGKPMGEVNMVNGRLLINAEEDFQDMDPSIGTGWLKAGLDQGAKMKERTAEVVAQAKHLRQEARITQEKSRETSILKVVFPQSIAGEYHHTSAHLWGEPQYGGKIEANIVYLGNTGCSESDYRDLSNAEPKNLIVEGAEGISYFKAPYILMIDRGGCNFVPKVRRAQQFGASAVLISDHLCLCSEVDRGTCHSPEKQCEATSPLMADDGSGGDVTIPSFLIWNTESNNIKQQLGYDENVLVEMAWNLPAPDDRVEWDMWTSSWDPTGLPFKTNFVNTVAALGDAAFFQPHWQIITHESCRSPEQFCFNQCTNQGRYCQVDPDGNSEEALQIGLSGADVIREDLREMCIWELSQDKSPGIGLQWWQYVTNHSEHCSTENGVPSPEKWKSDDCARTMMDTVGIDKFAVMECMLNSGGLEDDVTNTMLEKMIGDVPTFNLIPSIYVNEVYVTGAISTSRVLATICRGYLEDTQPDVCLCVEKPPSEQMPCVEDRGYMKAKSSNTYNSNGFSTGSVLLIVFFVVSGMASAGYLYWKRTQQEMRQEMRDILKEYMPVGDDEEDTRSSSLLPQTNGSTMAQFEVETAI